MCIFDYVSIPSPNSVTCFAEVVYNKLSLNSDFAIAMCITDSSPNIDSFFTNNVIQFAIAGFPKTCLTLAVSGIYDYGSTSIMYLFFCSFSVVTIYKYYKNQFCCVESPALVLFLQHRGILTFFSLLSYIYLQLLALEYITMLRRFWSLAIFTDIFSCLFLYWSCGFGSRIHNMLS